MSNSLQEIDDTIIKMADDWIGKIYPGPNTEIKISTRDGFVEGYKRAYQSMVNQRDIKNAKIKELKAQREIPSDNNRYGGLDGVVRADLQKKDPAGTFVEIPQPVPDEKFVLPSAADFLHEMLQEYIHNSGQGDQDFTPEDLIDCRIIEGIHSAMRSFARLVSRQRMEPLEQENAHLRRWKSEAIALWDPLIDYGYSPEAGLTPGQSIADAALNALKETPTLREERAVEKHKVQALGQRIGQLMKEKEESAKENKELISERDQWMKYYNDLIIKDEEEIAAAFMRIAANKLNPEQSTKLLRAMGRVTSIIDGAERILKVAIQFPPGAPAHPTPIVSPENSDQ